MVVRKLEEHELVKTVTAIKFVYYRTMVNGVVDKKEREKKNKTGGGMKWVNKSREIERIGWTRTGLLVGKKI